MSDAPETINSRTIEALGEPMVTEISRKRFCIVGCGAVGAMFAEMLVRTGATILTLIDGDDIEITNLNRTVSCKQTNISSSKVKALRCRLLDINPDIHIDIVDYMFRDPNPGDDQAKNAVDKVTGAAMVIIAMDDRHARYYCERACSHSGTPQISVGIETRPDGGAFVECARNIISKKPKPEDNLEGGGYGHGSYMSIVVEATAIGFNMMLAYLADPCGDYKYEGRTYKNFRLDHQAFCVSEVPD